MKNKKNNHQTLLEFTNKLIEKLKANGKERTAETYQSAVNSFMCYRLGDDILLRKINREIIESYEAYLKQKGLTLNTISFYMRKLRAIYNLAVDDQLIVSQYNLFKRVYTSNEKTLKRAIPLKLLTKIKHFDLKSNNDLEFVRDLFLFSFYTRGMSFVDIAYLRKKDIRNGYIIYVRRKTGQRFQIKLEKSIEDIILRYQNTTTNFLFPIITSIDKPHRVQYIDGLRLANKKLKKLAQIVGVDINLTMYVARHSWASLANSKNIPISIISEAMGHNSQLTTQIYLKSLDGGLVDEVNCRLIGWV